MAGVSTWSPDSKQIAYAWYVTESNARRVELRVVGLDGGKPRVLTHYDGVREMGRFAWSPDGKHVAASVYPRNGPVQIVLVSVTDGSARPLIDLKR
jgi:Tol biopolymer transport system component